MTQEKRFFFSPPKENWLVAPSSLLIKPIDCLRWNHVWRRKKSEQVCKKKKKTPNSNKEKPFRKASIIV